MVSRHIVGMGGGGFEMETDNTLLDDFILSLARRSPARLCFLPTASGDSSEIIVKFYRAFRGRAVLDDLTLQGSPSLLRHPARSSELENFVLEQDIIYVGGGNTANLLALWRAHGLDLALRRAWQEGVVLAGLSAGLICWFECSVTDSFGPPTALHDGLGLIAGSACPHYAAQGSRGAFYRSLIAAGLPAGYGVDDGAALHFEDTHLVEVVSSRAQACAYHVSASADGVQEERLAPRFLGA